MRKPRIGDRFEWINPDVSPGYAYRVEWTGKNYIVIAIVTGGITGYKVGDAYADRYLHTDIYNWRFVGNFNKVDNFNELYNILNGTD